MKNHKRPLNRSMSMGCTIFIFLLCVVLSHVNLSLYRNYVYEDYRGYIANILYYTLDQIDGDDLKICIETGQQSEKYQQSLLFMDNLMDHFDDIHYFYAILPLNTQDKANTMSVLSAERYYDRYVDTEGNLYLGWISDDEFDAATAAQFMDILHGEGIVYFEEQTEWGRDYTGALPIRDSSGEPVAVLALDIDISFITGMIMRYAAVNICVIGLLGTVFIAIFLLWSRENITRPIRQLEQSAVGFADQSHGQRDVDALVFDAPRMNRDDEIKALSDAVVKMTHNMRDYVNDIISAEQKARNFRALANRDSLTGIRNKTAYDHDIRQVDAGITVGITRVGLAVVDLNYLKRINDTYGHDKGNILLLQLCSVIQTVFSRSPVYRIGGDEFVIILKGTDYLNYDALLQRFQGQMERFRCDPSLREWERVSAAIGAAFYDPMVDDNMESVFKRADRIMYECKTRMKAGRRE